MLDRTPNAIRCALRRNDLKVRDIRCDVMSVNALARILRVRKAEIHTWIEKEWLQATTQVNGKRLTYIITPEAFRALYTHHLHDLIEQKRVPNLALFEAFYNYCFVPTHTVGTQLLTVRRDKRERAAFMAMQNGADSEEEDDETQEGFRVSFGGDMDSAEDATPIRSDRCEHCGAWLSWTRISIRETAANVVCGSLLLAVLTFAGYADELYAEGRMEEVFSSVYGAEIGADAESNEKAGLEVTEGT